jgi:N-hydroxyarylamine O-acetyltransferase
MAPPGPRWLNGHVIDEYLQRIGLAHGVGSTQRPAADVEGLRALQAAHLRAVPFENLSIHLGERIELTQEALLAKVVDRRRGGFCYELNGAFAGLLRGLGYRVTLLQARVFGKDGSVGPPYDHLALRVDLAGPWLADVGFGRFTAHPVRLDVRQEQADPAGAVLVRPAGADLDVLIDGVPQYRLEQRPRELADFRTTCWYHQTSPESHFTRSLVCSLPVAGGYRTLSDHTLIETVDGVRTEKTLADDAEVLAAYGDLFGIVLDRLPSAPAGQAS